MLIKIIIVILSAILFRLGGWKKNAYRDIGIPLLLALYYWNWWLLLSFSVIRCGYGIPDSTDTGSFLGRIFKTAWATRGVWAFLVSGIGALPLVIYTHHYLSYIVYISLNTLTNAILGYFNAEVNLHEITAGACLGSIVLFI